MTQIPTIMDKIKHLSMDEIPKEPGTYKQGNVVFEKIGGAKYCIRIINPGKWEEDYKELAPNEFRKKYGQLL